MASVQERLATPGAAWKDDLDRRERILQGIDGGRVRLVGYDGARKEIAGGAAIASGEYTLQVQSAATGGKHAAFLHSGTANGRNVVPTSADAVLLIEDAAVTIGTGAALALTGPFRAVKIATPSAPPAGYSALYPKADENWYKQTSAADEVRILDADLFTAGGQLLTSTAAEAPSVLNIGANKTILVSNGTAPSWSASPTISGIVTIETAISTALMVVGAGGIWGLKIATPTSPDAGLSALYPKADEAWYRLTSAGDEVRILDADIFTAAGQIPYGSGAEAFNLLSIGTAGQVLAVNSGATAPEWVASINSILTTTGDMIYASAANTPARLAVGANKTGLVSNGSIPVWSASPTYSGDLTAETSLTVGTTPAGAGRIRLPHDFTMKARNTTNTGDLDVIAAGSNAILVAYQASSILFLGAATSLVGFYGGGPTSQQTISGSRAGNAAVASIATALANLGLVINSTTA